MTRIYEMRTNGTANGGAVFEEGASGTDRTQQDAVHIAFTDLVIDGSDNTKATSAANPFTTDHIGNGIRIISGTGFTAGEVRPIITAVAAGVATFDTALGTTGSTGGVANLGGAKSGITDAFMESRPAGSITWVKGDGAHVLTESIVLVVDGATTDPSKFWGYITTRGDGDFDNQVTLTLGAFVIAFDNDNDLRWFTNTGTGATMMDGDLRTTFIGITQVNSSGTSNRNAFNLATANQHLIGCIGESTNGRAFVKSAATVFFTKCWARDSVVGTREQNSIMSSADMIISNCTTAMERTVVSSRNHHITNATIYNCPTLVDFGGDTSEIAVFFTNCVIDTVDDLWVDLPNFNSTIYMINCNITNETNARDTDVPSYNYINETNLDPEFTDAPNDDFTVGANLQGIGIGAPTTVDLEWNIGAAQNKAAGGSNKIGKLVGFGGGLV